jgi:hypothetical protein
MSQAAVSLRQKVKTGSTVSNGWNPRKFLKMASKHEGQPPTQIPNAAENVSSMQGCLLTSSQVTDSELTIKNWTTFPADYTFNHLLNKMTNKTTIISHVDIDY